MLCFWRLRNDWLALKYSHLRARCTESTSSIWQSNKVSKSSEHVTMMPLLLDPLARWDDMDEQVGNVRTVNYKQHQYGSMSSLLSVFLHCWPAVYIVTHQLPRRSQRDVLENTDLCFGFNTSPEKKLIRIVNSHSDDFAQNFQCSKFQWQLRYH